MAQLTEEQQNKVTEIKQQLNNEYQICFSEMLGKYTDTKVQEILNLDIKQLRLKIGQYKARKKAKSSNNIEEQTENNITTNDVLQFANKISYNEITELIKQLEEVRTTNKETYKKQLEDEKKQAEERLKAIENILVTLK